MTRVSVPLVHDQVTSFPAVMAGLAMSPLTNNLGALALAVVNASHTVNGRFVAKGVAAEDPPIFTTIVAACAEVPMPIATSRPVRPIVIFTDAFMKNLLTRLMF